MNTQYFWYDIEHNYFDTKFYNEKKFNGCERWKLDCVFDAVKNTELFDLESNIEKYQIKFRWSVIIYIVLVGVGAFASLL